MCPDSHSSGCLYLVASPIGNLADISTRAVETLTYCDYIACEDTRVTGKLLTRLDLHKRLISYREENEKNKSLQIAEDIEQGKIVALLSDAGYPCISDPGFRLVRECHIRKIKVVPIPGPNAALTALAVSGLPTHQYSYIGFLPKKSAQVRKTLESWSEYEGSIVLYESKYKIEKTLGLIAEILGKDRFVCVARELTKAHESIRTGPISQVIDQQALSSGKGEFTLVIAPQGYSF